jgi:hypothetical protein
MDVFGFVVAGGAVFGAPIERQEARVVALQPRGHVRLVLAHGEMNERAAPERKQRLRLVGGRIFGQARLLVLVNGALDGLV